MGAFKYDISFQFQIQGKTVDVTSENILLVAIDYLYNNEIIQPLTFVKFRLDKNLIDELILQKNTGRCYMYISKVNVNNSAQVRIPYIKTKCIYELADDIFKEKTIMYDKGSERQDVYGQITLGLVSDILIERNVINQDCIIKEGNMMGAVCLFTYHMPMVIEPFTYNDDIDQLVIEPQETVKDVISYLNNIKVFYDTPLRYFMDFNVTYLVSSSGNPIEVKGEESANVVISVKDGDIDEDFFELGSNYNEQAKCYELKIPSNDTSFYESNVQDKSVNKLVGIIDPSREKSLPGLTDLMKNAKVDMDNMISQVQKNVSKIGSGINDVVHGENVVNYNTQCTKNRSAEYQATMQNALPLASQKVDLYYNAAVKAMQNQNSGSNGAAGPRYNTLRLRNESTADYYYQPTGVVTEEPRPSEDEAMVVVNLSEEIGYMNSVLTDIENGMTAKDNSIANLNFAIKEVRSYIDAKRRKRYERYNELISYIEECINVCQDRIDKKNSLLSNMLNAVLDMVDICNERKEAKISTMDNIQENVNNYIFEFQGKREEVLSDLVKSVEDVVDIFKQKREARKLKIEEIENNLNLFNESYIDRYIAKDELLEELDTYVKELIELVNEQDNFSYELIDGLKENLFNATATMEDEDFQESYLSTIIINDIKTLITNYFNVSSDKKSTYKSNLDNLYKQITSCISLINKRGFRSQDNTAKANEVKNSIASLIQSIRSEGYAATYNSQLKTLYSTIQTNWSRYIVNKGYKDKTEISRLYKEIEKDTMYMVNKKYLSDTKTDMEKTMYRAEQAYTALQEKAYEYNDSNILFKDIVSAIYENEINPLLEYANERLYEVEIDDPSVSIRSVDEGFNKAEVCMNDVKMKDDTLNKIRMDAADVISNYANDMPAGNEIEDEIKRQIKVNINAILQDYLERLNYSATTEENVQMLFNAIVNLGVAIREKEILDYQQYQKNVHSKMMELHNEIMKQLNDNFTSEISTAMSNSYNLYHQIATKNDSDEAESFQNVYDKVIAFKEAVDNYDNYDISGDLETIRQEMIKIDEYISEVTNQDKESNSLLEQARNYIYVFYQFCEDTENKDVAQQLYAAYKVIEEIEKYITQYKYNDNQSILTHSNNIKSITNSLQGRLNAFTTSYNNLLSVIDSLQKAIENNNTLNDLYSRFSSSLSSVYTSDEQDKSQIQIKYESTLTYITQIKEEEDRIFSKIDQLLNNFESKVESFFNRDENRAKAMINIQAQLEKILESVYNKENNHSAKYQNMVDIMSEHIRTILEDNESRMTLDALYQDTNDLNQVLTQMLSESQDIINLYNAVQESEDIMYHKDTLINQAYYDIRNMIKQTSQEYNGIYDTGATKVSYKQEEIPAYSSAQKNSELTEKLNKLSGKNDVKIMRNVMQAMITNNSNTVGPEVERYVEQLDYAKTTYNQLANKSIDAGFGYVTYEDYVRGIGVDNIYDNINSIGIKTPINHISNTYVENKAQQSNQFLSKSQDINTTSTENSVNTLKKSKELCEYYYKLMQQAANSSGSGQNGSGQGGGGNSSSVSISPAKHKEHMKELQQMIDAVGQQKEKMDGYYSNMAQSVSDGVQYSDALQEAQANIEIFTDDLVNIQNNTFGLDSSSGFGKFLGKVSGFLGKVTDIANSITNFSSNLSDTINRIATEGFNSLGGNLSNLINGGLKNIFDLSDAGKTGATYIQTGRLNILDSGGHDKVKYIDLANDNPNKIKIMQNDIEMDGTIFTIAKDNIDNAIITLNKQYLIKNTSSRTDQNGKYLLRRKQEIYTREGELFICKTIIDFSKLKEEKK